MTAVSQRLRSDDRAVSPVIGVVLMLAVGMIMFSVLQVTAIPTLNSQHEFQHSQSVQTDLVRLESTVDRVAATGTGETAAVDVGLRYPPRLLFLNPPPVSGTLRTTGAGNVTVEHAVADGETGDFWNGTAHTFPTQRIVYESAYNEYQGAPDTVYEPWAVYNRQSGQTVPLMSSDLVEGRQISLVVLDGQFSHSQTGTVGVGAVPSNTPVQTVTVQNGNEPVTVSVPTELRQDAWERLLSDELDPSNSNANAYVTSLSCQQAPPEPCGELTLTFEPGTYELRLGEVAVGRGASTEGATYLTDVAGDGAAVAEGGQHRVVVQARDRFDNPTSGVQVTARVDGGGSLRTETVVTDDDGRAVFVYDAPGTVSGDQPTAVRAQFGAGGQQRSVTFDIRVTDTSDSGGSGVGPAVGPTVGPAVGQGGTETFAPSDTVRTISTEGGVWRDVTGVSELVLTNPEFAPTEAGQHEQLQVDQRHFRLVFGIEAESVTYYVAVTQDPQGLFYSPSTGAWSNREVTILTERGGTTTSVTAPLGTATLNEWRDDPTTPLDILAVQSYETAASTTFRQRLTEIKQTLRASQADIHITDMHGRIDLEASTVGQSAAYPDAFVDADGTTEPQEELSLSPAAPLGNLGTFERMQQSGGDDAVLTEQNKNGGMAIGTATYGVDQTGTTYTLDVRFRYDKGGGNQQNGDDVTVQIVDAQGGLLQTETLERQNANPRTAQFTLNSAARGYVQQTGDLYVVYRQSANNVETVLRVDFQLLRVQ